MGKTEKTSGGAASAETAPEFALTADGTFVFGGESLPGESALAEPGEEESAQEKAGESAVAEPGAETPSRSEGKAASQDAGEGEERSEKDRPYTPEEIRAVGIDKLDPSRLPTELVPFYKSMQAGFTRKMQELADERRILRAAEGEGLSPKESPGDNPAAGAEASDSPQEGATGKQDPFTVVFEAAKRRACSDFLGIDVSAFDEYNGKHMAAVNAAMREMEATARETEERNARVRKQTSDFAALCTEFRASEPDFDTIAESYFGRWMENLPYREHAATMRVFQSGSIGEIKAVIERVIGDYRKTTAKADRKTPPPAVESPRAAPLTQPAPVADPTELASMNSSEQAAWLVNHKFV